MMKFRAVSHRLIFWILGASASLFLATSYYEYSNAEALLLVQIKTKTILAKSEMINRVDNLLHSVSDSVHTAAAILSIAKADDEQIKKSLKQIVSQHKDIYGMTVAVDPAWTGDRKQGFAPYYYHHNDTIAYADLSDATYKYQSKDWYQGALKKGGPVWSEPYADDDGGNTDMVTYSVPVYTKAPLKRELVGVVTADVTLSRLAEIVSQLGIGENGFAYIVSRQGNIITHSDPSLVMTNIKELSPPGTGMAKLRKMLKAMLAGEQGTVLAPCRIATKENDQCWVSYLPIASSEWSIAIALPLTELNSSLIQYRDKSLMITVSGLLLLAVIIIVLSRRLTVPLLSLAESTEALSRGDLNTTIHDFGLEDEVGTLAHQFQRMQSALKDYIEKLKQETAQRERIEGELNAAYKIQMQMLPDNGQSNIKEQHWHLSALIQPAKSVGGDFYYYQLLADNQLFFAIGDVSDKGVGAALFMAKTQTLLRQLCTSTSNLDELLSLINRQLCKDNESCMFVTLLIGTLDTSSGEVSMANAGHNLPLLKTEGCDVVECDGGPALGFYEDAEFTVCQMLLPIGTTLVLTTDGIDEAANPAQQHYGEPRLQQRISAAHGLDNYELLQFILSDVVEFRQDAEPSDDLTMMAISRH